MVSHVPDSPIASALRTVQHRRRALGVVALLVVVAAVVALVTWAARNGQPSTSPEGGLPGCPSARGTVGSVPADPTTSPARGRLVPDAAPTSLVVCEYPGSTSVAAAVGADGSVASASPAASSESAGALGRSARYGGDDRSVTALVASLRAVTTTSTSGSASSCAQATDFTASGALVGLAYDGGTVWVGTADCVQVTNGEDTGVLDLSGLVTATLDGTAVDSSVGASVAPVPPDASSGVSGEPADPGLPSGTVNPADPFEPCTSAAAASAAAFVPFTPIGVRICHQAVDPSAPAATVVDRPVGVAVSLATALDSLPTLEPDVACTLIGGETWALLFTAADGSTASVRVDAGGCGTASNGVRLARASAAVYDALATAG